jgi:dolichol-phosphate mannosyltransferase
MEDPPDQIPILLREIERGDRDIVWGLRRKRHGPFLAHATSMLFSFVLNKATGYDIPLNVATLRVMNRPFVDAYNALTEKGRYIPGLEMWLGFRRGYVETRHQPRAKGRSSYTFAKRLQMAFEATVSFSDLPLRFLVLLGSIIALVGIVLALSLVIGKLFFTDYRAGYTSTISTIVFLGGMQILVVGVASLYIGRILQEVQNRPLFVIRDAYKVDPLYVAGAQRIGGDGSRPARDGARGAVGASVTHLAAANTRKPVG